MKHLILIAICMILISSCDKEKDLNDAGIGLNKPETPINDSIDINSDKVNDFVISYKEIATSDEPSSGGSIIGSIRPLNQNQFLYRNNVGNLFLNNNDTIRKVTNPNSEWNGYSADLISIGRHYQNWDKTWTILSENTGFYFLAYKLVFPNSEKIGWICLHFDATSGKMTITDGDISDKNELIINKKITN